MRITDIMGNVPLRVRVIDDPLPGHSKPARAGELATVVATKQTLIGKLAVVRFDDGGESMYEAKDLERTS